MQPKHFSVRLRNGKTYRKNKTIFCLRRRPSPPFCSGKRERNGSNNEAHQKEKKGFGDGKNPRRPARDCTPKGRCRRHDLRCNETTQQTPSAPSQPAWETPNTASVPSGFFSGVCCSRERQGGVGGGAKISPGGQDDKKQVEERRRPLRLCPLLPCPTYGIDQRERNAPSFGFPQANGPFQAMKRAVKK